MESDGHDRREFLVVSSMCALAAAVGTKLHGAEAASPNARVAVGFAPFDDTTIVIAASDIPASDGAFISRGARVSISGAGGAPVDPETRRMVGLNTHYSYFDGGEARVAPFHAWGRSRASDSQSSPVSFTIPVDQTQKISLGVLIEQGHVAGSSSSRRRAVVRGTVAEQIHLELGLGSDAPFKLGRGFYVLVPLLMEEQHPQWSRLEIRSLAGRWTLHDHAGNAVSLEHLVLRIDYAE